MSATDRDKEIISRRQIEQERQTQLSFYRDHVDPEEEITRPRCYTRPVRFLLEFKLSTLDALLRQLGRDPHGGNALVVCCGSGMEAEMLAASGKKVIGLDFSFEAIQRARERSRRFGSKYLLVVGDAEMLPFRSDSVEFTVVHDGLHHLSDPYKGIREMSRVAARAVLIAEPAVSVLTNLAIKLGIAGHYEDAGNFVYRLHAAKIAALFKEAGFNNYRQKTSFVYYQPWTHKIYAVFDKQPLFSLFRAGFAIINAILGRWGNSLCIVGCRSD